MLNRVFPPTAFRSSTMYTLTSRDASRTGSGSRNTALISVKIRVGADAEREREHRDERERRGRPQHAARVAEIAREGRHRSSGSPYRLGWSPRQSHKQQTDRSRSCSVRAWLSG